MNIYDRLTELNITLPPVAIPAAAYVPFVQTGNLVFLSGHIAKKDGKVWVGQLGANMSTEEAKQAAALIAELRAHIRTLEATNKALTVSRDSFQAENAQLKKQINMQRREIDRATGRKTA